MSNISIWCLDVKICQIHEVWSSKHPIKPLHFTEVLNAVLKANPQNLHKGVLMNPNNLMTQISLKHPAEFPLDHILSLLNKPEVRTFSTLAPSRQLAQYKFTGSVQTRKRRKVKLLSPLTRRRLEEDCGAGKEPSRGWIYIYIRGLGYEYGAPVYGNARSSDQ